MTLSLTDKLRAFPNAIRQPKIHGAPDNIESRRLKIYQELFYNNIEGFISSGFPVLRSIYNEEHWQTLIYEFMANYRCETPYFLAISQEFIAFLQQRELRKEDPPFLLELAHYEWVELALDSDEANLTLMPYSPSDDLLNNLPIVSPLVWPLCYQFPVHQISCDYLPESPLDTPTYLLVYRNRDLQVKFMESNAVTFRLLELLSEGHIDSGKVALQYLATEMGYADTAALVESGVQIMEQLQSLDVILGI